ncbi:HAD family hydrolase [Tahibacter amnicola]|uniref:HAD family hydrolase n=1 Tax=Tahibacter amnicola TaxID=2976241 RepID=A0ABY6BHY7_9GAMM|nr:HAD family hydrolase [Tahibacter amnicola]UXI67990.1 HAD family hydrolase [Tahibacter amnicola]
MQILAISLDLDDTLWPIAPIVLRAEQQLDRWLREHCPSVADAYPVAGMRALRERIANENPHLAHDFTEQRKLSLRAAFTPHGYGEDHVEAAFAAFYAARNQVDLFDDVLPALARLSARCPLVSLSNGNADLDRIGLRPHFAHSVSAREFGKPKPAPEIFLAACAVVGVAPANVLHVGDDPLLDVRGAREAGLRTAWINRTGAAWGDLPEPDMSFTHLGELADWLDLRLAA